MIVRWRDVLLIYLALHGGVVAFYVDGTTIPEVDWDAGPSWSGLLPISGDKDETRKASVPICFVFST